MFRKLGPILSLVLVLLAGHATAQAAAPTYTGNPQTEVVAGSAYWFAPNAKDADGDTLSFSIANKPSWAVFDTKLGRLIGMPAASHAGTTYGVKLTVSDGKGGSASIGPFNVTVLASASSSKPGGSGNRAPIYSGNPPTSVAAGGSYWFAPGASDPDGDKLAFTIQNKPSWATFNTSNGRLIGSPTASHVGTSSGIVMTASDGRGGKTSIGPFSITVTSSSGGGGGGGGNVAPTYTGTPPSSVAAGASYWFAPTAKDANGDKLTFSITNKPAWASFDPAIGRLIGFPTASHVGTTTGIVMTASDGRGGTARIGPFNVTVTGTSGGSANRAPTYTGSPPSSVAANASYAFSPTARDADGDKLSFAITNKPAWATFNSTAGSLSGVPTSANVGTTSGIVMTASDGRGGTASIGPFSITVTANNRAPTITGTPATSVVAGTGYSFTPGASDADGDTLSFGIANKPAWATFSTTTGRLSGTPTTSQTGTTANIVISVADGKGKSATLPAFSITVTSPTATGSATLSWTPPTQNEDGSTLTNLAGYRILYGTSSGALDRTIQVSNPGVTNYVIENLAQGTWYFAMKAYTSGGTESAQSSIVSKSVK